MEQQIRRPSLVIILLLIFLPALLPAVHGVDVSTDVEDDIGTNTTHTSAARWSVTVRKGGHGGHGHGRGHGNGGGSDHGRAHQTPTVINPRTISGTSNYHHRRSAAPGPELGRPSTIVATCCIVLLMAAISLLHC